jgi:hypothetical protein
LTRRSHGAQFAPGELCRQAEAQKARKGFRSQLKKYLDFLPSELTEESERMAKKPVWSAFMAWRAILSMASRIQCVLERGSSGLECGMKRQPPLLPELKQL